MADVTVNGCCRMNLLESNLYGFECALRVAIVDGFSVLQSDSTLRISCELFCVCVCVCIDAKVIY